MKISGINKQTPITSRIYKSDKKNVSKPSFKGLESAEHYAVELMKIDNSEIARTIIGNNKKLLPVKAVREFIAGFLNGVKNSPNTNEYTKNKILRDLWFHFDDFIYLYDGYYRSTEERLQAHEPKCSFSDIADNEGKITEAAMETAVRLAKLQGAEHYLPDFLTAAKDADGTIDRQVGYQVAELLDRIGDWDLKRVMQYRIYRDENGNVNRDLLDKIYHSHKDKTWDVINHWGLKTEEEVFKEYSKQNLFLPENYYNLIVELGKNKILYSNEASIMSKEIGEYGKILFILPDIQRTEDNKEAYDKILRYLSSNNTYQYDFNQKDKNGISFMEKVINSENPKLVDFVNKMNKKDLIYYPELDWAVNGIQNKEFKEKLKELDFNFDALEKAARLRSTLALRKLMPQLNSPLCDKEKMILHLWDIAKKSESGMDSKKEFGRYLCNTFIDDISEDTMFKIMNESVKG